MIKIIQKIGDIKSCALMPQVIAALPADKMTLIQGDRVND